VAARGLYAEKHSKRRACSHRHHQRRHTIALRGVSVKGSELKFNLLPGGGGNKSGMRPKLGLNILRGT
jgi:hypothetical protein